MDSAGLGTLHGPASAWAGRVNISANGLDESVTLARGEPVYILVETRAGEDGDPPRGMLDRRAYTLRLVFLFR